MSYRKEMERRFLLQNEYLGNEKPVNILTPLVSVTVATYQHVNYIRECLEGILMQNTSFHYEIIIGEDGSVDGTDKICKEYAEKYPEKIRLFLRDRNLSQYYEDNKLIGRFNGRWNRMSSRGKYIALCEGDDYWTDPLKLERQVAFLEANEDYGLVYTEFNRLYQYSKEIEKNCFRNNLGIPPNTLEDFLINTRFLAPVTWLFRSAILDQINLMHKENYVVGDLPMLLIICKNYKIGYIDESMAVYRVLQNSASHFKDYFKEYKFDYGLFRIQMDFANAYKVHESIIRKIKTKFYNYIFIAACLVNEHDVKDDAFKHLKDNNLLTIKMKCIYFFSKNDQLRKIFKAYLNSKMKFISRFQIKNKSVLR